jgi:hypothetical protein
MIPEIPSSRETRSRLGTLTPFIRAEIGLVYKTVLRVGHSLMTQQTRSRGEPGTFARVCFAAVWLQVIVDEFAEIGDVVSRAEGQEGIEQ